MRRVGRLFVRALSLGVWVALPEFVAAQAPARTIVPLNDGWRFTIDSGQASSFFNDSDPLKPLKAAKGWRQVTLPHTWNALDPTDEIPGYRRGTGVYARTLDVSRYPRDARLILRFEGANTIADVRVNGMSAARHVGAYVGFDVDITPLVRRDTPNRVLVKVSNADDPQLIPSSRSDFVIYGGLTRNVSLLVVPAQYIAHLSVRTPYVSRDSARATVLVTVAMPSSRKARRKTRTIDARLLDTAGRMVARATRNIALAGDTTSVLLDLPAVAKPALWSPASPSLYRLVVTLAGRPGARDSVEEKVGFRSFVFLDHGPFYLNGERLLLRGTQRHEERAGIGGAVPDSVQVADMAAIKAMGANFVRLAHYPQAPSVYRAADSLGILVWDELPWDRGGVGDAVWRANTKRLLGEQIRQNENHPSIILWSLGNEIQDVLEPEKKGDTRTLRAFLTELKGIATTLDPSRPTAIRKFDAGADIVDVYSPSIWAGWYRGVYNDYETALVDAMRKYPRMLHMEYGADAHFGRHTDTPITGAGMKLDPGVEESVGKPVANIARDGDWSESYQSDLLDWHLMVSERMPNYAGGAQWVFRDFATPLRPENPIPYVNEKGLTTRDGRPKDAWYLYRAYWTDSPHFTYIVSHSWTERGGPAGKPLMVKVYSNCANVDLRVNDSGQGLKVRRRDDFPAQGLRWDVMFREGNNTLVTRCGDAVDESTTDSLTIMYTSGPAVRATDIRLETTRLPDGHLLVEALLVDANGRVALDAADRVYFDYNGSGHLVSAQGTPTGSSVIEAANGRAAIEVVPPSPGQHAIVTARTQQLNGASITIGGSGGDPKLRP